MLNCYRYHPRSVAKFKAPRKIFSRSYNFLPSLSDILNWLYESLGILAYLILPFGIRNPQENHQKRNCLFCLLICDSRQVLGYHHLFHYPRQKTLIISIPKTGMQSYLEKLNPLSLGSKWPFTS